MKTYTVLLLYPDYLAGQYGADTYLDHVHADTLKGAITQAQLGAVGLESEAGDDRGIEPEDFHCLMCIEGCHSNLIS